MLMIWEILVLKNKCLKSSNIFSTFYGETSVNLPPENSNLQNEIQDIT